MTQKYEELIRDLQNKIFHPLYLLEGAEPYYIDKATHFMEEHILPESERSFNQTVLYGKETSALDIRTRALNYPMFSNYQVIIVKEAQAIRKWDDLLPYFTKPVKTTVLVLCHKHENFDKRTKAAKMIQTNGVIMTSSKLWENQLPAFVHQVAQENKLTLEPEAQDLFIEYVGNDLSRLAHELEKLRLNLGEGSRVKLQDIENNIGISKEYNVFELNKAIGMRNVQKAHQIVDYISANPKDNPLPLTLGALYNYFSRILLIHHAKNKRDDEIAGLLEIRPGMLMEYKSAARHYSGEKLHAVFRLLHEYDLRSKGVNDAGTREGSLLRELVYRIMH